MLDHLKTVWTIFSKFGNLHSTLSSITK